MADNRHLTLEQRISIQEMLSQKSSLNKISETLGKSVSTVSREIKKHALRKRTGSMGLNYNACALRFSCTLSRVCSTCHALHKASLCRKCSMCNAFCPSFQEEKCPDLLKPPYVCNGCAKKIKCTLEKQFYDAASADRTYKGTLSESRSGISLSEEEILSLDTVISPLIQQNQSPHHIYVTNKDEITVSERTIYRLIDSNLFTARNLDLRRKVRFSARKKTVQVKVDKKCRIGRSYEDFLEFMKQYPGLAIVELDSVEGKKGGKVLLTIHFTKAELMLAFIRERNDSKSVIEVFNRLYRELSSERFRKIFQVCLTDNGSEFSNPSAIEYDDEGNLRTRVFYCDPSAPYQKGSAETNHEFIREFIPKGKDMAPYTQDDISLMMDHINSYSRASLGDKCPYDMFSFLYGKEVLAILGCHKIPPQKVTLNSSIFKRSRPNEV